MKSAMKVAAVAVLLAVSSLAVLAQEPGGTKMQLESPTSEATPQAGQVFIPESNRELPGRVHTTYILRSTDGSKPMGLKAPTQLSTPGALSTTEEAETPQSLGCLYVKSPNTSGCIPNSSSGSGGPSPAGYGAIVLVDAYDNPDAAVTCRPLTATGDCRQPRS